MAIIEGRWDCAQCQNVGILGRYKECPECHAPRDQVLTPEEGVYFLNLAEVTDPDVLSQAGHGPDWNCGHCGVANRGDTKVCRECGRVLDSDDIVMRRRRYVEGRLAEGVTLSDSVEPADDIIEDELAHAIRIVEGRGEQPRVLDDRTFSMDDLPRSGALADRVAGYRRDLEDGDEPGPLMPIIRVARDHSHRIRIAGVVLATLVLISGAGLAAWFAFSTEPVTLTITGLTWERRVGVEQQQTFTDEGWSIPAGGREQRSYDAIHHYEQVLTGYHPEPSIVSRRVSDGFRTVSVACGTEVEDTGDGFGKTRTIYCDTSEEQFHFEYETVYHDVPDYRQDPVYARKYVYEIDRWVFHRWVTTAGGDGVSEREPFWPIALNLAPDERASGERQETYEVMLKAPEKTYTEEVDYGTWSQLKAGHTVTGHINRLGGLSTVDWDTQASLSSSK